jgi:MoaA/NifB/PqqE/SkfB family radical SAM enzyme
MGKRQEGAFIFIPLMKKGGWCYMNKIARIYFIQESKTEVQGERISFGYKGGTFSKDEILEAHRKNTPLTMDCAIPCGCLNNCVYCGFLGVNKKDKLKQDEIIRVFEEFAKLGGKSIKILGEGEPLLRKDILFLVSYIHNLGMTPVIFTCGDVLGSETLAQEIHRRSCNEIAQELYENGVTVMLKYEDDDVVQREGYSILRNKALELLLSWGFNREYPSRLGFAIVLLKETYNKIPSIFEFALENNIYPLICPLMPIGKMKTPEARAKYSPIPSEITQLKQRLVQLRESKGIKLSEDSDFPGGLPCDISRAGMYMDDVGNIKICEADEMIGNIRNSSLAELWQKCSEIKDRKYGDLRWLGLCFPKRKEGIIEPK